MKAAAILIAMLMSGTAIAQTTTDTTDTMSQPTAQTPTTTNDTMNSTTTSTTDQSNSWSNSSSSSYATPGTATSATPSASLAMASSQVVEPSNANPRRDARGIPVISAAATVPAGYNGTASNGEAMGGPLLDPNTGQPMSDMQSAPPCTRTVTDHCLQTYERHRR